MISGEVRELYTSILRGGQLIYGFIDPLDPAFTWRVNGRKNTDIWVFIYNEGLFCVSSELQKFLERCVIGRVIK